MSGQGPGERPPIAHPQELEDVVVLLHERDARERVFESFPDAVVLTDVAGRILDANRAALTLLGRPAEDLFGRPIGDVVDEHTDGSDDISRLTRAGLWQGPVEVVRPDGSRLDVLARSLVIPDDEEPLHLLVLAGPPSDPLTGALANAERRLAAVIDSATDAIIAIDRRQRIVVFNAAAAEMFRCHATEAIGQPLDRFIPERLRSEHRQHVDAFARTGQTRRRMGELLGTLTAVRADGEEFPIEATISRVDAPGGPLLTAIVRDVTERQRLQNERERLVGQERAALAEARHAHERSRRLQAVTDAALSHLSLDDLLDELLGRLRELLGADSASVLLLDRETGLLRVRANSGLERGPEQRASVPLGLGVAGRIAASGHPVVIEDLGSVEAVSPFLRRLRSLAGVPIVHQGEVIGVLHVGSLSTRSFDREDIALLEMVASRLAPVIESARLREAERAARLEAEADAARLRISRSIAEALNRVLSVEDTAEEAVRHLIHALGASAGALLIVDPQRGHLWPAAAVGHEPESLEEYRSVPIEARLPMSLAAREGRPVFLASVEERDAAFPDLRGTTAVGKAWAVAPLLIDGAAIGVLALSFQEPRVFDAADRSLMGILAQQCAQAVDRSIAYERERRALAAAEDARRRLALLQTLTARFSGALTEDEVARIVTTAAVAALSALSGIVMNLDEDGMLHLRSAHGYAEAALAGWEVFPADTPTPAGDAVRSGRLVVVSGPQEMAERYPTVVPSMTGRPLGPTVAAPMVASDRTIGVVVFTFAPGRTIDPADHELLSALGRHAGQAFERARLYETERVARREAELAKERTERLQAITEALADADTSSRVVDVLVDQTLGALGAAASCVVEMHEEGELAIGAARGYPTELMEPGRRFSVDDDGALAHAIRTRTAVWLASADEMPPFPWLADYPGSVGYRGAFAAIPLMVGDWVLGGLALQFPDAWRWEEEDREFLRAIARQCAQAWFRAQLHEAELASGRQLRRSERRYRSLVQATSAVEWTIDAAGAFVEPQPSWAAYTGQPWEEHRGSGWLNTVHPDDRARVRERWLAARDAGSLFEVPMRLWHAPSGEYHHTIARAAPVLDDADRMTEWVGTIVDVHEQRRAEAIAREREREARERLRAASERLAFLAEAGAVLAGSLLVEETLQRLTDLVVPRLADWCAIDMLASDGDIQLVALSHVDPAKTELARDLRRRYPPDPGATTGVTNVLRTGRPELMPEIPAEALEEAARTHPEIAELIHELQLRSFMIVPLGSGGRTFGAITFVWAESGRTYSEADLPLAEELAHRASVAIENARLYEAERHARREEAEARDRLRVLAGAGATMTSSLDRHVVISQVTRLLSRELCDWAAAFLTGRDDRVVDALGAHRDPALDGIVQRLITVRTPDPNHPDSLVARVLRTGEHVSVPRVSEPQLRQIMAPGEQLELAERLGFRSVVVVPLTARGRSLGALAAVRGASSPPFEDDDTELLREIGRRTALALDNARLYSERDYVAETLQRSLLPPQLPEIPGMEIGARYLPAVEGTSVGGDFYDLFETDVDHWVAVIGDVVGKGAAAASMMGLARYSIRTAAMSESRPSRILETLNQAFLRQTAEQRFCTACCTRVMRRGAAARVTISSGGHPLPLVMRADGGLETAGAPGTLLGVFDDPELSDEMTDLGPGDALILYTDGVTDERRGNEEFGERRLAEVVSSSKGKTAQGIADSLVNAVVGFRTEQPKDDIAILVLRMAP